MHDMSGRTYLSPIRQGIAASGFEPLTSGRTQDPANDNPTVRDRPLRPVREVEMVGEGRVDALRHVRRKSLGEIYFSHVDVMGSEAAETLGHRLLDEFVKLLQSLYWPIQHYVNV